MKKNKKNKKSKKEKKRKKEADHILGGCPIRAGKF